jgi:hypothetical protein
VHASDVGACITYLATQGVTVDVSARGSVQCNGAGCESTGSASVGGCAVSAVTAQDGSGGVGLGVAGLAIALATARGRRRRVR